MELAIVGNETQDDLHVLREAVARCYLPNRIIATGSPEQPSSLPLLQNRPAVSRKATLYICRNYTCRQPITDPHSVEEALQADRRGIDGSWSRTKTVARRQPLGKRHGPGYGGLCVPRVMARDGEAGSANGFTVLGATGLTTTRLGFGTYRVDTKNAEYRDALKKALRKSCNLIDTSTNYTDGDSERLVGSRAGRTCGLR